MHRTLVALSLFGLAALLGACMGQPVGLSAQRGSTIAIPLQGDGTFVATAPLGYGGSEYADVQRGELVFQLDGPGGFELTTRLAMETDISRRLFTIHALTARQIFVMVDIPTDAPLGTHSLYLVNRLDGVDTPVVPSYEGQIKILPESIEVALAGGGTETITGAPTPLQFFSSDGWAPIDPSWPIPMPSFEVKLNKVRGANGSGDGRRASAMEAQLTYPDPRVNILRVVPLAPDKDHYWITDTAGTATIRGVGLTASPISPFMVVFENTAGEPVLASEFQLSLVKATDQFGSTAIMNDWSMVLQAADIE
jgi:hypothetical protein